MNKKCKHLWKKTTFKTYDLSNGGGYFYYKCKLCSETKKEYSVQYL